MKEQGWNKEEGQSLPDLLNLKNPTVKNEGEGVIDVDSPYMTRVSSYRFKSNNNNNAHINNDNNDNNNGEEEEQEEEEDTIYDKYNYQERLDEFYTFLKLYDYVTPADGMVHVGGYGGK